MPANQPVQLSFPSLLWIATEIRDFCKGNVFRGKAISQADRDEAERLRDLYIDSLAHREHMREYQACMVLLSTATVISYRWESPLFLGLAPLALGSIAVIASKYVRMTCTLMRMDDQRDAYLNEAKRSRVELALHEAIEQAVAEMEKGQHASS